MTPQQMVGLAVRLFAIWLILVSFGKVAGAIGADNRYDEVLRYGLYVTGFVGIVIAVLLWFLPMFVAHKLIPRTKFNDAWHVPADTAVTVACVIFSLWLFIDKILPGLGYYLPLLVLSILHSFPLSDMTEFGLKRLTPWVMYIAAALFLALKPHKIAAFLLSDRTDKNNETGGEDDENAS